MTAVLMIAGQDVSAAAPWDVTVQTGRDSIDSQPDASVLEAVIQGWQSAGTLGDPVTLTDSFGMLFHGTITDLAAQLEPWTEHAWTVKVTAVGPLADLGRVVIGDEPWPQESDSARVARILTLAAAAHAVNPTIHGPAILPTDVDRRPALELAHDVAADALGVLWEQPGDPDMPIRYTPQRLRAWQPVIPAWDELPAPQTWADLPPAMTWDTWTTAHYPGDLTTPKLDIDAGRILADVELTQQISDLVRRVRIEYGPAPAEGETRPEAIAGDGTPELALSTNLADQVSADTVADSMWRARRAPGWRMTRATLRLSELPPAEQQTIRDGLAVGAKLTLHNVNFTPAPIGPTWQGYVEGWTHSLTDARHTLTLQLVDRLLIEPATRWQDIPPAQEWQQITPAVTWDDTVGGFAMTQNGR